MASADARQVLAEQVHAQLAEAGYPIEVCDKARKYILSGRFPRNAARVEYRTRYVANDSSVCPKCGRPFKPLRERVDCTVGTCDRGHSLKMVNGVVWEHNAFAFQTWSDSPIPNGRPVITKVVHC